MQDNYLIKLIFIYLFGFLFFFLLKFGFHIESLIVGGIIKIFYCEEPVKCLPLSSNPLLYLSIDCKGKKKIKGSCFCKFIMSFR